MRNISLTSVRTRVILLFLVIIVPLVVLFIFNYRETRRHALAHATHDTARIINFAVIHEEGIVGETKQILAMLANDPAILEGGERANRRLGSIVLSFPQYTNFGVARPDGEVYGSAIPLNAPVNVSDRSYFRDAVEKRTFSVGQYQVGRITGKPAINFGYPILDRDGNVAAVVYAALDLTRVAKFEYEVDDQTPSNSTYVRLDRNGSILASYPSAQFFGRGNPLEKPIFERISREKKGMFEAKGADGIVRLYLFSSLNGPIYGEGAYVLLGIPREGLYAELNRMLTRNLAILSGIVMVSLAIMWFGGNALIIRPVHVLTRAAKRLAAGDLAARSGLSSSLGELGQLGQTFDEMATNIEGGIQERQEAEKRIRKGLTMLAGLHAIDRKILEGANIEDTLQLVCDAVVETGYLRCWVGLADPDRTIRIAAVRGTEKSSLENLGIRWDDSPQGGGPSGTVIKTGKPYITKNLLEDNRFAPWKEKAVESGMRSMVSLPLKSMDGKVMGVLHVYSSQGNGFDPENIHDLETFAQQCTVAMSSARQLADLRDAHQRLSFHVNRMPLAYIVWGEDFRVAEWNPAAERIFGWKAEEAIGKHSFEWIVPREARPHVNLVWQKLLKGDEASYSLNANHRKDGKTITCEWFNTPLRDGGGNIRGVLSMVHDVTEKTQLERQLQTAQRMEAVGTLAGGIAHDFNNALTGIFGFGEMLRSQLAGNGRALSHLDEVLRCAERASTLTRQLLTYSRRQIIEPVNMSMNSVISELLKLISKVMEEHIELRTFLAKNLPTIRADRGQIEQVVMNLALNARDAMPGGGQLIIETGLADLDAEYVRYHPYMSVGSYVILTISDTGIGMDLKTQERVFEPFFTTKGPDKGTGLGLAMVYGIVKQHNGFIHLYSEPGKGTTFKIYFPPVEGAPDGVESSEPARIEGGTETILLAEDDESVRLLVESSLTELGYTVLVARNGEDAVALFKNNQARISLALLDVVMPQKGGKEAYEAMCREKPGLKVIFMSGYTSGAVHESFVLIAGVPFLAKPFGPGGLARKVREVLDKA